MQLDRDWAEFKTHNMKPGASAEAVIMAKRSFMAGAYCFLLQAEAATGNASDEERIELEANRLRAWVAAEAKASNQGRTMIDPAEWGGHVPA